MSPGPSQRLRNVAVGYWRAAVVVAVAGVVPALTAAIAVFGLSFTRSWSAHLQAAEPVRLAAAIAEWAMAAVFAGVMFVVAMAVLGRPSAQWLRQCAKRWAGVEIPDPYRPPRVITQMSTGYWWDGHEYHESEREAKVSAWFRDHLVIAEGHDPQLRRDVVWQAVAALTVVPFAAIPLVLGAGAIYAAAAAQPAWLVSLLAVGSVTSAPTNWRLLLPVALRYLTADPNAVVEEQVARLNAIRADLTHTQAVELERIERSLHDGAQARMVALGMQLGAAERLVDTDPEQVKQILREARASAVIALDQLRTLVRGINPPVLVERGLVDAIRALALDTPIEVEVRSTLVGRPEQPIEAALYFAVSELLTNVVKHANAAHVTVGLSHAGGVLRVVVGDDGEGGAAATPGSGLDGIVRRVAAFEGQVGIDSPAGGPTLVSLTVPCRLS